MVKSCFGLPHLPGTELKREQHRAVITETTFLNGCALISVYLMHSEGPSPENMAIMDDVASSVAAGGPRWILAMDANMPPNVFGVHQLAEPARRTNISLRCAHLR